MLFWEYCLQLILPIRRGILDDLPKIISEV